MISTLRRISIMNGDMTILIATVVADIVDNYL